MFTASRHAQSIAENFLNDVDDFQRASRDADRRAMSHFDAANPVSVVPIVPLPHRAHRGMYRRTARYGSVPPIGSSLPTYQRAVSVAPVPRHFYAHYYSDLTEKTPSYHSFYNHTNLNGRTHGSPQTSYIGASGDEQLHLREFKTSPHSYAALRTAYRNFYRPTALGTYPASLGSVSNEIMAERRKIDRRLDNLLDYKLPPADYFTAFKGALRSVQDKMDQHRTLLDRYSAIDMTSGSASIEDRVNTKCQELGSRFI